MKNDEIIKNEFVKRLEKELFEQSTIFGINLKRVSELLELFHMRGYDINNKKDWKQIKQRYFGEKK